jgi:hypothetical protein
MTREVLKAIWKKKYLWKRAKCGREEMVKYKEAENNTAKKIRNAKRNFEKKLASEKKNYNSRSALT